MQFRVVKHGLLPVTPQSDSGCSEPGGQRGSAGCEANELFCADDDGAVMLQAGGCQHLAVVLDRNRSVASGKHIIGIDLFVREELVDVARLDRTYIRDK